MGNFIWNRPVIAKSDNTVLVQEMSISLFSSVDTNYFKTNIAALDWRSFVGSSITNISTYTPLRKPGIPASIS